MALAVALGLGWALWNASFFPQPRQVIWRLDDDPASIAEIEVQIYGSAGELLKREQRSFESAPGEWSQIIALPRGEYPLRLFVGRKGGQRVDHYRGTLRVDGEKTIVIPLGDLAKTGAVSPR